MLRKIALASLTFAFSIWSTAAAAATPYRIQFMGRTVGANAYWTTCPEDPVPAGVVCTSTLLSAFSGTFVVPGSAAPTVDKFAYLEQFTYMYDEAGNYVPISDVFANDFAPNFSIDSAQLSTASLDSTMTIFTCTEDECLPDGTLSVSASWTGQGEFLKWGKHVGQPEHYRCVQIFHLDLYGSREGTFTGTTDGASPGTPLSNWISPELFVARHGTFDWPAS